MYNTWCLNPVQLTMGSLVFVCVLEFVCVQWKIWASASSFPAGIVESDDISTLIGEMETAVNYFQKVSSEHSVRGRFFTWPVRDLCPRCLNNSWEPEEKFEAHLQEMISCWCLERFIQNFVFIQKQLDSLLMRAASSSSIQSSAVKVTVKSVNQWMTEAVHFLNRYATV